MRKLFRFIRKVPEANNSRATSKTIHELFEDQDLTLLDIGAAGGIEPRWGKISSVLNYIGLEPDKRGQEINLLKNLEITHYYSMQQVRKRRRFLCILQKREEKVPPIHLTLSF